ncbi:hypothetical protein JW926_12555 [Candidatus Sumerlaeota bacterium]|nr:hypothetical protein [Candidatus Sumerlaeota bacterium]
MRKYSLILVLGILVLGNICFAQPASVVEVQKLLVSPSSGVANLWELVNFQIIVTNTGTKNFTSLTISDTYPPAYLDYISAEPAPDYINEEQGFIGFNDFIARFGPLAPGESFSISLTFRAIAFPAVAPIVGNSVTVSGYDEDTIPFSHPTVTAYVEIIERCASDMYESNDDQKQAKEIKICQPVRAYICPYDDVDFFYVLLDKDGYYMFHLYHLPQDYNLYLYEGVGAGPIEESTNAGTTPEKILIQRKAGVTIYIEVRANQTYSPSTPYFLHVSYMGVRGPDQDVVEPGSRMPVFGNGLPTGSQKNPGRASFYLDREDPGNLLGSGFVLPDGSFSSSLPLPGGLSGKHTIISQISVGEQLVANTAFDFQAKIRPIVLDCWIDDASLYTNEGKKPIVNKLVPQQYNIFGRTVVDVVCDAYMQTYTDSSAIIQILVESNKFGAPYKAYRRNSIGSALTEIPYVDDGGGQYHVELTGLSQGMRRQVVFRFRIPHSLTTTDIVDVTAAAYDAVWNPIIAVTVPRQIRLLSGASYMIFTTRSTLFRDHNDDDVANLLGQVYLHSQDTGKFAPKDKRAVIYYVDHYRTESVITNWNNTTVDYSSETNANQAARYIQWVIWDRFYDSDSVTPTYLLLIGNDEQFPMYRLLDPYNDEHNWEKKFPGGDKGNPALRCCFRNYYFTDNFYAYIPGGSVSGSWKEGNVDLRIGRIIGDSAQDMEQLYLLGLTEEGGTGRAVMASVDGWELGYEPDDNRYGEIKDFINVPARLVSKGMYVKNDGETPRTIDVLDPYPSNWATGFQNASNGGMDIFFIGGHNSYTHASLPQDSFNPADIPGKYWRFDDDNPISMIVGCHGGLPVPHVGWGGGVNNSMVYNVIHNGARAYFGAAGYSYGSPGSLHHCDWGELFLQYVFYYFIKGTSSSYTLGSAIRYAKNNYPFGIGNCTNLDKKTVTEYNLFGVPWQVLDYPGSGGGSKSLLSQSDDKMPKALALEKKLMLSPRKVTKLAAGAYIQQFYVDTTSWQVEDLEDFQIINIPEGEQLYIPETPLLPALTAYSIALPPDGKILGIAIDEYTTQTIGDYNIPTVKIDAWTEGGIILSGDTEINSIYPPQLVYSREGTPSHYLFTVFPVRHNPTTDETVFHEHLRVTVEYEAPIPFGILNFAPDAMIFSSSEIPEFHAEIFNMSDADLDLEGLLSILDADTMTTITETGMNLHVLSGGIYALPASAGIAFPQGEYIARLKVSHASGSQVMAETEFAVDSAYLSNLSGFYQFSTGEVPFSLNATNLTESAGILSVAFNIFQEGNVPIDTVHLAPIVLNPEGSQVVSEPWKPAAGTLGTFTMETISTFDGTPLNSLKTTFTIYAHQSLLDALLDHLLGRKELPVLDRDVADFNNDFILDISDVVSIMKEMP